MVVPRRGAPGGGRTPPPEGGDRPLRSLDELIDTADSAYPLLQEWVSQAEEPCRLLDPAPNSGEILHALQVTTRSLLGTLAYHTGGLLLDSGWVRFLGSGHPELGRTLTEWTRDKGSGFLLVGDDAVGGFFALNGGALSSDLRSIHYLAPDNPTWENLEVGLTDLLFGFLTGGLTAFYAGSRWEGWRDEIKDLPTDRCINFWPPLWFREGSVETSSRGPVPLEEAFSLRQDLWSQIAAAFPPDE